MRRNGIYRHNGNLPFHTGLLGALGADPDEQPADPITQYAIEPVGKDRIWQGKFARYVTALQVHARHKYTVERDYICRVLFDCGIAGERLREITVAETDILYSTPEQLGVRCSKDHQDMVRLNARTFKAYLELTKPA